MKEPVTSLSRPAVVTGYSVAGTTIPTRRITLTPAQVAALAAWVNRKR